MRLTSAEMEKMSVDEKLEVIQQLWDSLQGQQSAVAPSESEKAELLERAREAIADPAGGRSWEEVRADLIKGL